MLVRTQNVYASNQLLLQLFWCSPWRNWSARKGC